MLASSIERVLWEDGKYGPWRIGPEFLRYSVFPTTFFLRYALRETDGRGLRNSTHLAYPLVIMFPSHCGNIPPLLAELTVVIMMDEGGAKWSPKSPILPSIGTPMCPSFSDCSRKHRWTAFRGVVSGIPSFLMGAVHGRWAVGKGFLSPK